MEKLSFHYLYVFSIPTVYFVKPQFNFLALKIGES